MADNVAFDPADFINDFRIEADEHLHALDAQLLKLERDPSDPLPIRAMFISAHTIKGGAAMLSLSGVADLAHAMEGVLARLRDDQRSLDRDTADLLFRVLDVLRDIVPRALPGIPLDDVGTVALAKELRQRAIDLEANAANPGTQENPLAKARRVLIVDDSATVRMLATMQFSDAGYQVDAVADGKCALNKVLQEPYDLLVTSIEMQGLRGLDLVAALRAIPEHRALPVIVMSADNDPNNRQQAVDLDVQAYIQKGSIEQGDLVETANQLLVERRV